MRLESKIQTEILDYLKPRGFAYKHEPVPTGIPDIHFIPKKGKKNYWFEVKRSASHKPSEIQLYIHKKLRAVGDKVYVVWSLDMVKNVLSKT